MDEPATPAIEKPFGFEQRDKKATHSSDVTVQDILYDVQETLRGQKVLSCLIIFRTQDAGGTKTGFRASGATEHIESSFLRALGRFMSWENTD